METRTSDAGPFASSRFLLPLLAYVAFAAIVYVVQGSEPPLNIDHISYMKLANEIQAQYPGGDYWRSINSVRFYGVLLAYVYEITGSHVTSFKLLLAAITVAYLFAFQLFMGLATGSRREAVLFSIFSAFFISFGASMWGVTDFSASLNRTIIIPFVVLLTWFFFARFQSPWRYAIYPALVILSVAHLSALHVFLVFGVFEILDFAFRRRLRIDRDVAYCGLALIIAIGMQLGVQRLGVGATSYVQYAVSNAMPQPAPATAPGKEAPPGTAHPAAKPPAKLGYEEAWKIELQAFPWRNFPLPFATIVTIALSFGVILMLALAGGVRAFRGGAAQPLDRQMARFAAAVPIAAFGFQATLWTVRSFLPVLPINFEEVRAINMIVIPAVYFIYRLYETPPSLGRIPRRAVRVAIMAAFALQPIVVLRAMPLAWREAIIQRAVRAGTIKPSDSLRMLFARQYLGIEESGPRFYYSSRAVVAWLKSHSRPGEKVLTNLNEAYASGIPTVGPFLNMLDYQIWDPRRARWAETLDSVDKALAARDLARLNSLARALGATYIVVDWPAEGAVYRDPYYSVIRAH